MSDRITTDITKTVIIGVVIATFQKQRMWVFIPYFKVSAHRGKGVRQQLLIGGF
jgi:hypothetical protein